ncbi:MAG TPA: esterase [Rubrivivax sp.]|jgi:phospholipase/carboxylesterase|nr:esterase [Rubrivivax sp.]
MDLQPQLQSQPQLQLALPIEWLPASGTPEQLIVLLHGQASSGSAMAPLAQALRAEFPQAAILAPDAPLPAPGRPGLHQWFDAQGISEEDQARCVASALPPLLDWVRHTQQRVGVGPAATAIAGFSQGAVLALETCRVSDGLAGRVLSFSGRFAVVPEQAPRHTTVHLFHGGADLTTAAAHSRAALHRLAALKGDATLDIAEGVGHVVHPALVQRALFRLRNHIPARTWAAALGSAPSIELAPKKH